MSNDRPTTHRICPMCGIALVGAAQDRDAAVGTHSCPRCKLVIDVNVRPKSPPHGEQA